MSVNGNSLTVLSNYIIPETPMTSLVSGPFKAVLNETTCSISVYKDNIIVQNYPSSQKNTNCSGLKFGFIDGQVQLADTAGTFKHAFGQQCTQGYLELDSQSGNIIYYDGNGNQSNLTDGFICQENHSHDCQLFTTYFPSLKSSNSCCAYSQVSCDQTNTNILHLTLVGMKLAGNIPDLSQLQSLQSLNVSHNLFSGTVPASMLYMPNLVNLDVSHNKLNVDNLVSTGKLVVVKNDQDASILSSTTNPTNTESGSTTSPTASAHSGSQSSSSPLLLILGVSGGVIVLAVILFAFCIRKKKVQDVGKSNGFKVNSVAHVDGYSMQFGVAEQPTLDDPSLKSSSNVQRPSSIPKITSDLQSISPVQPIAPPSTTKPKNYITKNDSNVSAVTANESQKLVKGHSGVSSNHRVIEKDHSGVSTIVENRKIEKSNSILSNTSIEDTTQDLPIRPVSLTFSDKPNVYKENDVQIQPGRNPAYATSETAFSDFYSSEYESQF